MHHCLNVFASLELQLYVCVYMSLHNIQVIAILYHLSYANLITDLSLELQLFGTSYVCTYQGMIQRGLWGLGTPLQSTPYSKVSASINYSTGII